jgi:hypothetical protein
MKRLHLFDMIGGKEATGTAPANPGSGHCFSPIGRIQMLRKRTGLL